MASPQEVNRQVALALGRVIIPLDKADCHTHAEGVTYLYSEHGVLYSDVRQGQLGPIVDVPWNPAENPADALACLEEWCRDKMQWAHKADIELCAGGYSIHISTSPRDEDVATVIGGMNLPEAICQAILAARGDAT